MGRKLKGQSIDPIPNQFFAEMGRKLFTAASDGMFVVNGAGEFVEVNAAGCEMVGCSHQALLRLSLPDLFSDGLPLERPLPDKTPHHEITGQYTTTLRSKNGRSLSIDVETHLLVDGRFLLIIRPTAVPDVLTSRQESGVETWDLAKFPGENPYPVMRVAQDGVLLYANPASAGLLENWGCTVGQSLPDTWRQHILDTLASGLPKEVETAVADRVFSLVIVPLAAEGYVNVYGYDITDRKQVKRKLRESQEQLAGIIASAMDAIVGFDESQNVVLFNAAAEQMFGRPAADVIGQPHDFLLPERFRAAHRQHIRHFSQTGVINHKMADHDTLRALRADGQEFPIEASISQVKVGEKMLYTAILRDVTERKQAEKALRESEERYHSTLENMLEGCQIIGFDWRYLYLNASVERHGRRSRDGLLGRTMMEAYPGIEHTELFAILSRCMTERTAHFFENKFYYDDGSFAWFELSVQPVPEGLFILSIDVTERKLAEATIAGLHRRVELILNSAGEGIYGSDVNGRITFVNPAMAQMTGWEPDELLGQDAHAVFHHTRANGTAFPITECSIHHALREGRSYHTDDDTYWRKDGASIAVEYTSTPIWEDGQVAGMVMVVKDITERKWVAEEQALLEEQLRQSQKLESIGRLAGGVAHDFNNQLTIIQLYSDLIRSKMAKDDPLLLKLEQIRQASDHAASLTQQLLAFSRKQILQPVALNLNNRVAKLHKMLARLIGEDINLSTVLEPGLWPVTADPGQIEQVIMNLVVNARDAMPVGGLLTIETSNLVFDERITGTHLDAPLGPCVMLAVTDTGQGMDEVTQKQIFEPFFTTKEPGKGTGLGLATVHGIVKQSDGAIFVYSEMGQGTTFKIYLPANENAFGQTFESPMVTTMQHGSETILLVEDEAALRDLVRITLEEVGYTVLEADDSRHALDLVEQYADEIDLLLTDVVMPHISGRDLAQGLNARQPGVKVLFMSGYMDDDVLRHGLLTAEVEFLSKPFTRSMLASKVRSILDKP